MASIKHIDGRSIHQIQAGQVIVDLCSVVKELVENSVDAGASVIDIRFKNQGLDLIEVQDNGSGISPENYSSIALKHYTSKLSSYSDISSIQTFGFRGEALASLCALSNLTVITCLAQDVPKGSKLSFERSGKLKDTSVTAAQRGTTVSVDNLFHNLPVRRRELDRNIKREWQKVIALLNQYACIQTNLKFSVSHQPTKGKRVLLFSTKGNPSTRENIINIFGAKTMTLLVSLDLSMEIKPSNTRPIAHAVVEDSSSISKEVRVVGHVSRPFHGEGRQTPDRQMFFVNGRPCALPQFAKTFNEVYRSYNASQSPFIFADIQLDTDFYDVNVSPDKRSILLHDQNHLLESLRSSLIELFDTHDYSVPLAQPSRVSRQQSSGDEEPASVSVLSVQQNAGDATSQDMTESDNERNDLDAVSSITRRFQQRTNTPVSRSRSKAHRDQNLVAMFARQKSDNSQRRESLSPDDSADDSSAAPTPQQSTSQEPASHPDEPNNVMESPHRSALPSSRQDKSIPVRDFNRRLESASFGLSGRNARSNSPSSSPSDGSFDASSPVENLEIPSIRPLISSKSMTGKPSRFHKSPGKTTLEDVEIIIGEGISEDSISSPRKRLRRDNLEVVGTEHRPLLGQTSRIGGPNGNTEPLLDKSFRQLQSSGMQNTSNVSHNDRSCSPEESLSTEEAMDVDAGLPMPTSVMMSEQNVTSGLKMPLQQSSLRRRDDTLHLTVDLSMTAGEIRIMTQHQTRWASPCDHDARSSCRQAEDLDAIDEELKLSLIIAKKDFARMRVIGQFNLGFIIVVRPARKRRNKKGRGNVQTEHDEVFIIDQHASDEKYNFERLQKSTIIQAQRLVHPKRLQLTALEEEIILDSKAAIEANGFKVDIDTTGRWPIGSRCQLTALPLSRETTFGLEDLEELISLLGEKPSGSSQIPRPSKVRKMLAMRACRSSIMIGKALTESQMYAVVRHMGELDKPWNCPHGRPTMRHLARLPDFSESLDDAPASTE